MSRELIRIESLDDPRVEVYRNLRDKDLRREHGSLFMAESEMVVRQLLRTPAKLHSLLAIDRRLERATDVLEAVAPEVPIYVCEKPVAEAIVGMHLHRGMLAAAYRPRADQLTLDAAFGPLKPGGKLERARCALVVAEGISDTDNMGSLFRNAAALGAAGIVLSPDCCDPLYRKAVRTSVGHALSLPFAICSDWPGDLARLRDEWGLTIVGAETLPEARPPSDLPRLERVAVLVGSEGYGLSEGAVAHCDALCEIPMALPEASLNVAAATAVMLYALLESGSKRDT